MRSATTLNAEMSKALPFLSKPANLDGTMPGTLSQKKLS